MRKAAILPLILFLSAANAGTSGTKASFAQKLYLALADNAAGRNFVFSPYSISRAMRMAAAGARGATLKEIDAVVKPAPALPAESPEENTDGSTVITSDRAWIQKGLSVQPAYLQELEQGFSVDPGFVDFQHHADEIAQQINQWVETQTKDKIKNLIAPGTLDASSRLVLVDAIYFKSSWATPFKRGDTFDDDFILTSGRKARVPYMHSREHFDYAETDRAQVLRLPYARGRYSMLIALPKDGVPLKEIESSLQNGARDWEKQLHSARVHVSLPRFRFDSGFLLNDELQRIGIRRAFSFGQADFSGIDGTHGLYVSQVIHKAFLSVDEEGTEAAAATAVAMRFGAILGQDSKPIEFSATRPFIFWIEEKSTHTVLFMGRLMNPRD